MRAVRYNEPMIHFDKVSKRYGAPKDKESVIALDNVDLIIEPREFVTIVGHSGAGKTTLLKLILAEERPSSGIVTLDTMNLHKLRQKDMTRLRRRIGTVFQDFRLIPDKTAFENVAFAMEACGRADHEIAADVPHILALVGLENKMTRFPRELSGGEKQRVAIARAIVNHPDILIADEPAGNLDPENTYDIVSILRRINDMGTTVILATHNAGIIDAVGRRVVTMEKGRVAHDSKHHPKK